jgi:alpha-glucosidase
MAVYPIMKTFFQHQNLKRLPRGKLRPSAPGGNFWLADFQIEWQTTPTAQLNVRGPGGRTLLQTIPGEAFVLAAQGQEDIRENRGMFKIRDGLLETYPQQSVDEIIPSPARLEVRGELRSDSGKAIPYSLVFSCAGQNILSVELSAAANRLALVIGSRPQEHFFGFGEQFTYFDMKGREVPIWVSEQGVGRGEQPLTFLADLTNGGAGGNAFTTYAPMPICMTSDLRGFLLENTCFSRFDLRDAHRMSITVFDNTLNAHIYLGDSPSKLIHIQTGLSGRMPRLPDWVHAGAIIGMQGGTAKVREIYAKLREKQVPVAAFWLQDWVGQRRTSFGKQLWWNWELDHERYPGWQELVRDLQRDGVRVMTYINPYLADLTGLKPNLRRNLFREAKDHGYLVMNAAREPYLLLNTDFRFGMIDLTNPAAWDWYKSVIKEEVAGCGASGWMADFGESLPCDAVLAKGEARLLHNSYPVLWAALNRQAAEEIGGEVVFFHRAAFTNSAQHAALFWEGDQMVDWSREDGLKSAVTGINTGGLSGLAINHSDIGGYTTITHPLIKFHRSRELLYRWMELSAFTPIFRTHEGNQPEQNVQFYSDAQTLETFARWAKVFASLGEYRQALAVEAAESGLPLVRHPFIHYHGDPETRKITFQEFMLGPDLLVAPVTTPGVDQVTVYLPPGEWVHLWSEATHRGAKWLTLPAPLGQPGVFYPKDSPRGTALARKILQAIQT